MTAGTVAIAGVAARAVIAPRDRDELAAAIAELARGGRPYAVLGGETDPGLGNPPRALDTVVRTGALDRVIDYAPEDQTITVEAGMTFAALDRVLAAHEQQLPLDVADRERTTIGGAIATNAFGARRHRYGSLKDMIVGIEIVRPDGTRAHGGGKVVKNVAGFDLPKLMVGALGTLGTVASATLRVHPVAEAAATIVVRGLRRNVEEGNALVAALTAAQLEPVAYAWHREAGADPFYVLFEGTRAGVEAQVARALELAAGLAAAVAHATPAEERAFWEYEGAVRLQGAWRARTYTAPALVNLEHDTGRHAWSATQFATCYPSLGVFLAAGADAGQPIDDLLAAVRIARLEALGETIFHAMPARWLGHVDAWGEPPPAFALMRALKARFDPAGVCNPGRFVGGL